jgi:hypothetical protein
VKGNWEPLALLAVRERPWKLLVNGEEFYCRGGVEHERQQRACPASVVLSLSGASPQTESCRALTTVRASARLPGILSILG